MDRIVKLGSVFAFCLIVFLVSLSGAFAQNLVVVPNSQTNIEGGIINLIPFNCGAADVSSVRYQQVYLGSMIGKGEISKISFRLDESNLFAFGPTVIPNSQIEMSVTPAVPGALSDIFANNIGPTVTTVFSGDLSLSAPDCTTVPCPFDIMIPLQTPFFFDPAEGNLLVDMRLSTCINLGENNTVIFFDAVLGDPSTSRVRDIQGGLGIADDVGLITEFEITHQAPVTITKITDPPGGVGFEFVTVGFNSLEGCEFMGQDGVFFMNDGDSINCMVPLGSYSIKENIPNGYKLAIVCFEAPDNMVINSETGEINFTIENSDSVVDCLYTNVITNGGSGGGCTLAPTGFSSSIPLYLFIPVLILIRRIIKRYRS